LVKLKTLEAYTRDVGRGIARIDYDSMDKLKISTGDFIKINGAGKNTICKALPLYPSDENKQILRIDSITRENANLEVKQFVEVEKTMVQQATMITVFPNEIIPPIDPRYLADALESIGVVIGDMLAVPYFGGRLSFQVKNVEPDGPVVITQRTGFKIDNLESGRYPEYDMICKILDEKKVKLLSEISTNISKEKDMENLAKSLKIVTDRIGKIDYVKQVIFKLFNQDSDIPNRTKGIDV